MLRLVLGETKLERQLRLVVGLVLLISLIGSHWWIAHRNESLIREASRRQARRLVDAVLIKHHLLKTEEHSPSKFRDLDFANKWATALESQEYSFSFVRPKNSGEGAPQDEFERRVLERFLSAPAAAASNESRFVEFADSRVQERGDYHYYQAVRAKKECIKCHVALGSLGGVMLTDLNEGDLMAVVKIVMPDSETHHQINYLRASSLATGIVVTFLAMCVSFVMIRWVVVRSGQ